ncbi:Pre-rRNA-processing ESF1-like protein [Hirschfeldia incana]|nr:Pre-rRNA-processing ESF1-like protein [Hirschfeldia incana]
MGSKRKKGDNGGGGSEEGKQMITDSRFSTAHTDPRFRRLPRRESKVTIDSRFKGVLTDKASAPVDKRGKRRRRGSAKDSLKEYYRIDEEDEEKDKKKQKQKRKEEDESEDDESEGEEELMALEAEARLRKSEQSDEEEEESKIPLKLASDSDEESDENADSEEEEDNEEEEDTDEEDDGAMSEDDDGPEVAAEEIASIEKETHRLAIVNMDWRYVSAKDLYVVFNSFLPKDGRLLSVTVYPSEFGLERMKEEEIHGPAIGGDKKNEDNSDDEDEEEDEDAINERLRDYEKSRLRYYFAVAECDSSATADHLYKQCDGIEFERSSNKLDLRFIPDSMEFKHPPRDTATEAPATYQGLDFQSQALQMSKVNVSWDEDEPHRVRTLRQGFNPDQLAKLEVNEFLASDESESDDSDGDDDEEKIKEKYLALMESGDVDSDKDEDEENDQDMVVEFNTGLEDLSNKFREKKEEKPETVWETQLRKMREKKKARKMQKKDDDDDSSDDSSDGSDDEDDYNADRKKKEKKKKMNKNKKGLEEKLAADEKSLAELELIVADDNGKGLKGYNIKGKGKKRSKEMAEDKIPSADPDDQRFSVAFTDPNYALDPTNPQFKRSATYVKQLTQKQKQDPRSQEEQVKDVETKTTDDGTVGPSKKRSFAESATVKSMKLKMQQKGSEKKKEGTAELAQRVKNKAKALSKK